MIAYLEGKVQLIRRDSIILNTGNIGYEVFVASPELCRQDEPKAFYTYQQFREDGQSLFGFESEEAYQIFTSLIGVRGIGCKSAMNILSSVSPAQLMEAVENSDTAFLKKLPGIGAKTAGQIILDLKGKIDPAMMQASSSPAAACSSSWQETAEALTSLGYKPADFSFLEKEYGNTDTPVDQLLRTCLQQLAKRRKG